MNASHQYKKILKQVLNTKQCGEKKINHDLFGFQYISISVDWPLRANSLQLVVRKWSQPFNFLGVTVGQGAKWVVHQPQGQ